MNANMMIASSPSGRYSRQAGACSDDGALENVLKRVRLRARLRVAWLRKVWSDEEAEHGSQAVTHAEIDTHLDDRDSPEAEAAWLRDHDKLAAVWSELRSVEDRIEGDTSSRLLRLRSVFGLDDGEFDLLQACAALSKDPSLARVYAYLHDHAGRGYVTEGLAARLFGHGRVSILRQDSPLRHWGLIQEQVVEPGEPAALALDSAVYRWLEGGPHAPDILRDASRLLGRADALDSWPVTQVIRAIRSFIQEHGEANARVVIAAQPRSGRKTFAASVAEGLGFPAPLAVDTDRINDADWDAAFRTAVRHALLEGTSLVWHGDAAARRRWPDTGEILPLHFLAVDSGVVPPSSDEFIDERVELPPPSMGERRTLWTRLVPESAAWPRHEVDELAARHRALPGEIAIAARHSPASATEASALIRDLSRERLGDLAERVETPFGMEDLVVEDALRDSLEELVFEAKERPAFWEQPEARRMFPQGRGLLAMFSGAPGTGKTMAAQVIAADLGLDLFRIDLSSVVSKYVGETSQNLDRILSRAAHMDAVLLFDEADALFGKRTEIRDAHDRFANTDTNYLLQAIESFQGVALLSTNKKGNVDPAFVRRLRYVLEFRKPDAAQRRQIWERVLGALQGAETVARLRGELDALAEDVEATGAQIKFAALNALFAARRDDAPVSLRHLVHGLERELGKEGRSLSNREKERLMRGAG